MDIFSIFKHEPAYRLAMAGYHQHYLQNSFEQPRVLKACEMSNTASNFNVSASYVQFQMSHQITLTQDTNAKGFSACCESSYGNYLINIYLIICLRLTFVLLSLIS